MTLRARGSACVVSLLAVLVVASGALAADPVSVQADGFTFWDGTRIFVASGNVTVRWRDAVVTADTLRYDAETEVLVFEGNVVYVHGDQELAGARLVYDLNAEEAVFQQLDAILYAEGVDGPMYVRGERVTSKPDQVLIEGGRLTTCECEADRPPAYHFAAREIEIYPGERLIVRGVTFYEHGVPLLYLPYMTLSLRQDASHFDVPQIGYSSRTGWYIKTTYNYVLESGLYGALLLDYFQYLGPGAGVRHTYRHDASGRGTVLVYGVGNADGGVDGTFEWDREWILDRWRLGTSLGYEVSTAQDSVQREEVRAQVQLEQTAGQGTARGQLEYRLATGTDPLERLEGSAQLQRSLGGDWELDVRVEGFEHETPTTPLRRWLGYGAELRQAAPNYTLAVRLEQQVNPDYKDEDKSPNPPWTHVSRLPEITVETRALAGLDLRAGVARLKEEPAGTAAWRGEARLGVPTRTLRLGQRTALTASAALLGRAYSTDDRQLSFETRAGVSHRLAAPLSFSLQHTYRQVWGDTPFRFDSLSPQSTLSARLNWRSARLTAGVSTSYNLLTQSWNMATLNAAARFSPDLSLRAAASYDIETASWQQVVATLDWQPADGWIIRLGGQYNVPKESLERVDAQLEMALPGGWKAGLTAIYSAANNTFPRSEVFIAHDADCRVIRLRYDHERQEVWLEYEITAFPSSRVAVGASQDKLMFEADALSEFLEL